MLTVIHVVVVLIIFGLVLWAATQFKPDPWIMNLIRVVVVVAAVLYLLGEFGLLDGIASLPVPRASPARR